MQCPHCGHGKHKVIDTRERGETIRRRRQCLDCEQRFTTYEHVAPGIGCTLPGGGWFSCLIKKGHRHIDGGPIFRVRQQIKCSHAFDSSPTSMLG